MTPSGSSFQNGFGSLPSFVSRVNKEWFSKLQKVLYLRCDETFDKYEAVLPLLYGTLVGRDHSACLLLKKEEVLVFRRYGCCFQFPCRMRFGMSMEKKNICKEVEVDFDSGFPLVYMTKRMLGLTTLTLTGFIVWKTCWYRLGQCRAHPKSLPTFPRWRKWILSLQNRPYLLNSILSINFMFTGNKFKSALLNALL